MLKHAVAAALLAVGWPILAHGAIINGAEFTPGLSMQIIGDLQWSASPGTFQVKTAGGYTGVGISGGLTGDEIDIGETLVGTSSAPLAVQSITLGVLFDGPEFGDVDEVAQIRVTRSGGSIITATLTAIDTTTVTWTAGGVVSNLSPAQDGGGAVWRITDPFAGISDIVGIEFTALPGLANGPGAGTNQSDYTLVQLVTAVPEPASLLLFGAGLLGLGLARWRSRAS